VSTRELSPINLVSWRGARESAADNQAYMITHSCSSYVYDAAAFIGDLGPISRNLAVWIWIKAADASGNERGNAIWGGSMIGRDE
jgi:hypothetical protein